MTQTGSQSGAKNKTAKATQAEKPTPNAAPKTAPKTTGVKESVSKAVGASDVSAPKAGAQQQSEASKTKTKPESAPLPTPAPQHANKHSGLGGYVSVALIALVIIVAALTSPQWISTAKNFLASVDPTSTITISGNEQEQIDARKLLEERARMRAEIDAIMGRIHELEATVKTVQSLAKTDSSNTSGGASAVSVDLLSKRIQELEGNSSTPVDIIKRLEKLETTEQEPVTDVLIETFEKDNARREKELMGIVDQFQQRLVALETGGGRAGQQVAGASALILAVANLRDKIRTGQPYTEDLDVLTSITEKSPEIDLAESVLGKMAETGIPSISKLRQSFSENAAFIVEAANASGNQGWASRTLDELSSLVRMRRVGERATFGSVDHVIAETEIRLAEDDLIGAVKLIDSLGGETTAEGRAAVSWLTMAKKRIVAEKAIGALGIYAVSLLKHGEK